MWWLICAALLSPHLLPNFLAASPIWGLTFYLQAFIIIKSNFAHEKTTALQKHAKRWKKAYTNTPAALSAEIHPLIHTKGHKNGDLKTGNVSPRTASVRGAWRNPTFCCVYCDLCPRTIAFLSLQILSGRPHGLFPIRRHYNRRFLRCQALKTKVPEIPRFQGISGTVIF